MLRFIVITITLLLPMNVGANETGKGRIYDAEREEDIIKQDIDSMNRYMNSLGNIFFVNVCREKGLRYVLALTKGNALSYGNPNGSIVYDGVMFYLKKDSLGRNSTVVVLEKLNAPIMETNGGIYSLNIVHRVYEKMIKGRFKVIENFTVEMVDPIDKLPKCSPAINVDDP